MAKRDRKRLWLAVPSQIDSGVKINKDDEAARQHPFAHAVALPHCGYWCLKWLVYLIVLIFVGDLERLRGSDHRLHGREDVLIDQFGEAPFVLV